MRPTIQDLLWSEFFDDVCDLPVIMVGQEAYASYKRFYLLGKQIPPLVGIWILSGPQTIREQLILSFRMTNKLDVSKRPTKPWWDAIPILIDLLIDRLEEITEQEHLKIPA